MASTIAKNTVSNRDHAVKSGVLAAVETSSSLNCCWVGGWVLLLGGWVGGCRCWAGGCRVGGCRRGPSSAPGRYAQQTTTLYSIFEGWGGHEGIT